MAKPPPGCGDEYKAWQKAKSVKGSKGWFSKERKAADKKSDKAKERYKACVKARDDVMVLLLMKATLRVRKDLGMKVPMDWKKVPIEDMNKYEEKTYARLWKKQTLAACVDVINKENKKLGIQRQVAHAAASLAADRIADRWETVGKVWIWIIIAGAVAITAVVAAPAAGAAGAAGSAGSAGAAGAATEGVKMTGKALVKKGATELGKRAAVDAAKTQVRDPSMTMKAIKGITEAGGSATGGRLRDAAKAAEGDYQAVKKDKVKEIEAIKAEREAAIQAGQKPPADPLALPAAAPTAAEVWYKDPKILTGIGVGVGVLAIAIVATRR